MGVLKDISSIANTVAEVRRAAKFVSDVANMKKQLIAMKQERDRELRRRGELEAAIRKHKAAMADCPRNWESDQVLWKLVE